MYDEQKEVEHIAAFTFSALLYGHMARGKWVHFI
jgi:hypothetical protein